MKYNAIPNTDLNVSSIALGTWVFSGDAWGEAEEKACMEAVDVAVDCGINFIDTAPIYGNGRAEIIVGKAIKGKREKTVIATKCGLIGSGKNISINLKPDSIKKEIDASLQRLGIDYIDLYQCHWPDPETPIEETMKAMAELQQKGKIRFIGVSNFDKPLLERALKVAPVVTLQNQYSMLDREIEPEILPFCNEKSVGVLAYGPLAGGILTGKYKEEPKLRGGDARSFFYKYYSGEKFRKVKQFLAHLNASNGSLNQLAINWVRQHPGVTSVICGGRNGIQVRQNAAAASWDLLPSEMEQIREWIKHDL
jgi:aryl-alcohol dehydrogenase-like predicted oxidoreductase